MVPRRISSVIKSLAPEDYLDAFYGDGIQVVLLHRGDDLALEAASNLAAVDPYLGSRRITLWACLIETAEHAKIVQVVKLPQFRFAHNGSELKSVVGVMAPESIREVIYAIEDRR